MAKMWAVPGCIEIGFWGGPYKEVPAILLFLTPPPHLPLNFLFYLAGSPPRGCLVNGKFSPQSNDAVILKRLVLGAGL